MTGLKLRPGTKRHDEALYRAACDYQNGASLEAAARANRVHANTLLYYLRRIGWPVHSDRAYPGRPKTNSIPDELLDAHPRLTARQIADICGVSRTTVRKKLIERGTWTPRRAGQQPTTAWANSLRNRRRVLTAVDLRERGYSYGQIAIKLGVSRPTVGSWLRQYRAKSFLWQREQVPAWWKDPE